MFCGESGNPLIETVSFFRSRDSGLHVRAREIKIIQKMSLLLGQIVYNLNMRDERLIDSSITQTKRHNKRLKNEKSGIKRNQWSGGI